MNSVLANLLSYWLYYIVLILSALVVSPILVHGLGNDDYGLWALILSATGYATFLDLGINAAIVRLMSMHVARQDVRSAQATYSTSLLLLGGLGAATLALLALVALVLLPHFAVPHLSRGYLHAVFLIAALDIALGIFLSAFLGTLAAMQQFVQANTVSIVVALLKSVVLVLLLLAGHGLLTVALVQVAANVAKYGGQYLLIRRKFAFLRFRAAYWSPGAAKNLLSYGAYGLLITMALKVKLYTDAVVIGKFVSIAAVAFYAIPASIIEHVERLALAGIAVLTPRISAHDAVDEGHRNRTLYVHGTKYALLAITPIMFVLFTAGDRFLLVWMDKEFAARSTPVLRVLLCGYFLSLPQLLAHGILKGTSRHRMLAFILIAETLANIGLSLYLVRDHGLRGVALGTTLPLLAANLVLIPVYTCRVLSVGYLDYLRRSYSAPLLVVGLLCVLTRCVPLSPENYLGLALYACAVTLVVGAATIALLDREQRTVLATAVKRLARGPRP